MCPDFEIEHLSTADKYNETILTRLRTADGIPLAWFVRKFGNKLYDYLLSSAKPHISHKKLVIEDDKRLLISWLRSPSAVILESKKIKSVTVSIVSPSICHEVMGPDAMIFVF